MTNNFNNLIRKTLKEYVKPSMSLCENVKISKDLKYHLDNKITLSENIFRGDSKNFFNLINEVRSLYNKNLIKLNEDDCWIIESNLNKNVILENKELININLVKKSLNVYINKILEPQIKSEFGFECNVIVRSISWQKTYWNATNSQHYLYLAVDTILNDGKQEPYDNPEWDPYDDTDWEEYIRGNLDNFLGKVMGLEMTINPHRQILINSKSPIINENDNLFGVYNESTGVRINGDGIDLSYYENIKKILQKLINRELIPKLIEQNKVYDDFTDLQINVKKILVAKNQDRNKNVIVIDIIPHSNITWGRVISGMWELLEILGISKSDFMVEHIKPTHNRLTRLSNHYSEEYLVVENKQSLPFSEEIKDGKKIRTFLENISSEELKWRFDNEDRIIRPLNETNWQYQSDNQLPILLENNKTIYIPKGKYHRLIKGSGELKVEISTKGTY